MSTENKKPTNNEFKGGEEHKGNSNLSPKANKDQSANQARVEASHTPKGKDYRMMQDGDTKVQNPNRNLAQGGNNMPYKKK